MCWRCVFIMEKSTVYMHDIGYANAVGRDLPLELKEKNPAAVLYVRVMA